MSPWLLQMLQITWPSSSKSFSRRTPGVQDTWLTFHLQPPAPDSPGFLFPASCAWSTPSVAPSPASSSLSLSLSIALSLSSTTCTARSSSATLPPSSSPPPTSSSSTTSPSFSHTSSARFLAMSATSSPSACSLGWPSWALISAGLSSEQRCPEKAQPTSSTWSTRAWHGAGAWCWPWLSCWWRRWWRRPATCPCQRLGWANAFLGMLLKEFIFTSLFFFLCSSMASSSSSQPALYTGIRRIFTKLNFLRCPSISIRFYYTQLLTTKTPVFLCVGAASLLIVNLWKPSPKIRGCWLFWLLQDKDSFSLYLRLFDRACPDDYTYCTTSTKLRSFPRSNIFPRSNMRNKNARDARQKTRAASMYKQVKAKKNIKKNIKK